jgi:hypothetical protein
MQVGTYPTRNFATLGPSRLQPPFTLGSIQCVQHLLLTTKYRAGIRPYTSLKNLAESCVFIKQSPLLIQCQPNKERCSSPSYPFYRSFEANLPSSFNTVISLALVCPTKYRCRFWYSYKKIYYFQDKNKKTYNNFSIINFSNFYQVLS